MDLRVNFHANGVEQIETATRSSRASPLLRFARNRVFSRGRRRATGVEQRAFEERGVERREGGL